MLYLRARYYAPGVGRFITRDTWSGDYQTPLTFNRWNYTSSNPINYTDPSGNSRCYSPHTSLPSYCEAALQVMHTYATLIKQSVQSGSLEPVEGLAQFVDFSKFVFQNDISDMMWGVTLILNDYDANRRAIYTQVRNEANNPNYIHQDWLPYRNNPSYNDYNWCDSKGKCGGGGEDYGLWIHSLRGDWKEEYWDKTSNQAFHFWFFAAVSFFDGRGWAVLGNVIHDGFGQEDYDYISSPENEAPPPSGDSKPDYELSFQGMALGTILEKDARAQKFWEGIYGNCDVTKLPFITYKWTDPGNWIRAHLKG